MTTNIVDTLAKVPLLSGLDRHQLEKLADDFTERTFPAGTVVVREGDEQGIGFFVVAEGDGTVSVGGSEIAKIGPGSYFGEVALVSDRRRTATVTAVVFDAAAPRESVTVSLTWKMLEVRNWCVVVRPTPVVVSPKSHS